MALSEGGSETHTTFDGMIHDGVIDYHQALNIANSASGFVVRRDGEGIVVNMGGRESTFANSAVMLNHVITTGGIIYSDRSRKEITMGEPFNEIWRRNAPPA
ncbi:MAG: hypothetical protein UY05_C0059G0002 [Candidatus Peregrinibacteria bacterium GW2011_GWA2_47_7]|nr:MAG: hypothetical protein UY05_C0059G0002 [Candidatus Peregrinibacteria bacterium GW2011_GWA2_47_7]